MRRANVIDDVTAAILIADAEAIQVHHKQPISLGCRGLAGTETVDLYMLVNGEYVTVYEDDTQVQFTTTRPLIILRNAGTYKLTKGVTASGVSVDRAWSGS